MPTVSVLGGASEEEMAVIKEQQNHDYRARQREAARFAGTSLGAHAETPTELLTGAAEEETPLGPKEDFIKVKPVESSLSQAGPAISSKTLDSSL